MGLVRTAIDGELFKSLMTEGIELHNRRCTTGLPHDAELVNFAYDYSKNTHFLIWKSPQYPDLPKGAEIPVQDVRWDESSED